MSAKTPASILEPGGLDPQSKRAEKNIPSGRLIVSSPSRHFPGTRAVRSEVPLESSSRQDIPGRQVHDRPTGVEG